MHKLEHVSDEKDPLRSLVTAARLYYEQDLSQAEIAQRLGRSRPTVSRMLAEARDRGIVHIEVRDVLERSRGLELALADKFGLRHVRVIPSQEGDGLDELGRTAAALLQSLIVDGMTVGVSNGRALAAAARFLKPQPTARINVVQIIGSTGADDLTTDGPDIARSLAIAYGAQCRFLHVPLVARDHAMRELLAQERTVAQTLKLGRAAELALVGVGTLEPDDRSPIFAGSVGARELARIQQQGAVGHVCGTYYDENGRELPIDINRRILGIGLDAVRRMREVLAIASGANKAPAILGGIRGGLISSLVTDEAAASRLLVLGENDPRRGREAR